MKFYTWINVCFFKQKSNDLNQEEIIDYIKILFGIFSKIDIPKIKDDFNLEDLIKNPITNSFEEYLKINSKKK